MHVAVSCCSGKEEGITDQNASQMLNPPMVHQLACPTSEDRAMNRLIACARGDGSVSIYDVDMDCKSRDKRRKEQRNVSEPVFQNRCHSSAVTSV